MSITPETMTTIASALLSCAATYGMVKAKVDRLEADHKELVRRVDEASQKFVSVSHFDAVVNPLKESIKDIQSDIKKILGLVSRHPQE